MSTQTLGKTGLIEKEGWMDKSGWFNGGTKV